MIFQPKYKYVYNIGNNDYISEYIPPSTSDNILAPALSYIGNKSRVKFGGGCLKQDKVTFTHGKTIDIYTVYERDIIFIIS